MSELDSRLAEIDHRRPPSREDRALVLAAAACALGEPGPLRAAIAAALDRGVPPARLREALLQTYLFAGYPRAINALALLAERAPEAAPAPVSLEAEFGRDREWRERGEHLCRRVYGAGYERLIESMGRISPDLARWMVVEGYGKVLSRPELDAPTRERCAVAALAVLRVPDQLRAHLRGSLHLGVEALELEEILRTAALLASDILPEALTLLAEVEERWRKRGAPRT